MEQTNKARKLKEIEQLIVALEEELQRSNEDMSDPNVVADYSKLSQVLKKQQETSRKLEEATAEWEKLID